MLVLTRKQNEKIRIGDNITITVVRMKGKAVRLGIEAPKSVNVLRGELVFDVTDEEGDLHSDRMETSSDEDQSSSETIIECRIPKAAHQHFVI